MRRIHVMPVRCISLVIAFWFAFAGSSFAQSEGPSVQIDSVPVLPASDDKPDPFSLGDALHEAAKGARRDRRMKGFTSLVVSAATIGLGVWRFTKSNPKGDELARGLGIMIMSIGAGESVKAGVFLSRKSGEEKTYKAWKSLSVDSLTPREKARFEGELRTLADLRKRDRSFQRWVGVTRSIVGVAVLSLINIPDLNQASRRSGYIVGGVLAGAGMLELGISFQKSSTEKIWAKYVVANPNNSATPQP